MKRNRILAAAGLIFLVALGVSGYLMAQGLDGTPNGQTVPGGDNCDDLEADPGQEPCVSSPSPTCELTHSNSGPSPFGEQIALTVTVTPKNGATVDGDLITIDTSNLPAVDQVPPPQGTPAPPPDSKVFFLVTSEPGTYSIPTKYDGNDALCQGKADVTWVKPARIDWRTSSTEATSAGDWSKENPALVSKDTKLDFWTISYPQKSSYPPLSSYDDSNPPQNLWPYSQPTWKLRKPDGTVDRLVSWDGKDGTLEQLSYTFDKVGTYTLTVTCGSSESLDIEVSDLSIDLDIDSDNTVGPFADPERDLAEDDAEEDFPGKLVLVNRGNWDDDTIPNFADGFSVTTKSGVSWDTTAANKEGDPNSRSFTPVYMTISQGNFNATYSVKFAYSASAPDQISGDPIALPPNGKWRLWKRDGHESRDGASAVDGGDFIPANTSITLSQLGFSSSKLTIPLYLESVSPTSTKSGANHIISVASDINPSVSDTVVASGVTISSRWVGVYSMEWSDFQPLEVGGLYFENAEDRNDFWTNQTNKSEINWKGMEPQAFLLKPELDQFERLDASSEEDTYKFPDGSLSIRILGGAIEASEEIKDSPQQDEASTAFQSSILAYFTMKLPLLSSCTEYGFTASHIRVYRRPMTMEMKLSRLDLYDGALSPIGREIEVSIGQVQNGRADLLDREHFYFLDHRQGRGPENDPKEIVKFPEDVSGQGEVSGSFHNAETKFPADPSCVWLRELHFPDGENEPASNGVQDFTLIGVKPGVTILNVAAVIDGKIDNDHVVLRIPIVVNPITISDPSMPAISVARQNSLRRKAREKGVQSSMLRSPLPLNGTLDPRTPTIPENIQKYLTQWSVANPQYQTTGRDLLPDYLENFALTGRAAALLALHEKAMFHASQIIDQSRDNTAWREDTKPIEGDLEFKLHHIATILQLPSSHTSATLNQEAEIADVIRTFGAPSLQLVERYRKLSEYDSESDYPEQMYEYYHSLGKTRFDMALLFRMKFLFSMTRDGDDLLEESPDGSTVRFTPWTENAYYGGQLTFRGRNIVIDDILLFSSPAQTLFEGVFTKNDWPLGHPFNEDVLNHMVIECSALEYRIFKDLDRQIKNSHETTPDTRTKLPSKFWPFGTAEVQNQITTNGPPHVAQYPSLRLRSNRAFRAQFLTKSQPLEFSEPSPEETLYKNEYYLGLTDQQQRRVIAFINQDSQLRGKCSFYTTLPYSKARVDPTAHVNFLKHRGFGASIASDLSIARSYRVGVQYRSDRGPVLAPIFRVKVNRSAQAKINEYGTLLTNTGMQLYRLSEMRPSKADVWWNDLRNENPLGFTLLLTGDLIFSAQSAIELVKQEELATGESIGAGGNIFRAGLLVTTFVPGRVLLSGGKRVLGLGDGAAATVMKNAAESTAKLSKPSVSLTYASDELADGLRGFESGGVAGVINEASAVLQTQRGAAATVSGEVGPKGLAAATDVVIDLQTAVANRTEMIAAETAVGGVSSAEFAVSSVHGADLLGPYAPRIGTHTLGEVAVIFDDIGKTSTTKTAARENAETFLKTLDEFERMIFDDLAKELGEELALSEMMVLQKTACFPAGTVVLMADGSWKTIERIEVGDSVMTRSENLMEPYSYEGEVLSTTRRLSSSLVTVKLSPIAQAVPDQRAQIQQISRSNDQAGDRASEPDNLDDSIAISMTPEHPVWVTGTGWQEARLLKRGDFVAGLSGVWLVASVESELGIKPVQVFNFEVGDFSTYFVLPAAPIQEGTQHLRLRDWLWVHNTTCGRGKAILARLKSLNSGSEGAKWSAVEMVRLTSQLVQAEKELAQLGIQVRLNRGVPKGNSQGLSRNLTANGIDQFKDLPEGALFQAQHIAPSNVLLSIEMLTTGIRLSDGRLLPPLGYRLNYFKNGMRLPAEREIAELLELPIHLGSHPNYDMAWEAVLREWEKRHTKLIQEAAEQGDHVAVGRAYKDAATELQEFIDNVRSYHEAPGPIGLEKLPIRNVDAGDLGIPAHVFIQKWTKIINPNFTR